MGSGSSSAKRADEEAIKLVMRRETEVLNKLVDVFHVDSEHAQNAIKSCSEIRLSTPTLEDCLRWIEVNPSPNSDRFTWSSNATSQMRVTPTSITSRIVEHNKSNTFIQNKTKKKTQKQFISKEQVAEQLSTELNCTFVPLRTNGNGNCLFNAVVLCLRHCRSSTLISNIHTTFFHPGKYSKATQEQCRL